jgi:hypothetical protein
VSTDQVAGIWRKGDELMGRKLTGAHGAVSRDLAKKRQVNGLIN